MATLMPLHNNFGNDHNAMLSSLVQISQYTNLINGQTGFNAHEDTDSYENSSSANTKTASKKSKKRSNTQTEGKSRKRTKELNQKDETDANSAPKRLQVPRACSNCRRMHAGCGVERPCKRCVHNGLEATCLDVPRKKRAMKKGKSDQEEGDQILSAKSNTTSPSSSPQIPSNIHCKTEGDHHHHQLWQDAFHEVYGSGNSCSSSTSSSYGSLSDIDLSAPLVFGSDSENPELFSCQQDPISQHAHHINQHASYPPHQPSLHDVQLSVKEHEQLFYNNLLQEFAQLNHNNKSLESKISSLSSDLSELKRLGTKRRNDNNLISQQALMDDPNVSVSIWLASFADLVLVDCDENFVEIMGLPMMILKDNFPFSRVLEKSPSDHIWPKKVQISTLTGVKDVMMTINMLNDGTSNKYFVVHILEL